MAPCVFLPKNGKETYLWRWRSGDENIAATWIPIRSEREEHGLNVVQTYEVEESARFWNLMGEQAISENHEQKGILLIRLKLILKLDYDICVRRAGRRAVPRHSCNAKTVHLLREISRQNDEGRRKNFTTARAIPGKNNFAIGRKPARRTQAA